MVPNATTDFDPFTAPSSVDIATLHVRDRGVIRGTVTGLSIHQWATSTRGLHATITDASGSVTVAFLGRSSVPGVEVGTTVTAAGTVVCRRGSPLIMNPHLWLDAATDAPIDGKAARDWPEAGPARQVPRLAAAPGASLLVR